MPPPSQALHRRQTVVVGVTLILTLGSLFYGIQWLNAALARPVRQPEMAIDAWIPFWPAWIYVYLSFFVFCTSAVFSVHTVKRLRHFALGFIFQYAAGGLAFALAPTKMAILPIDHLAGYTHDMFAILRSIDSGGNAAPSMHVANALLALHIHASWKRRHLVWAAPWCLLILASTVFVKQHYVFDVITGVILGWLTIWGIRHYASRIGDAGAYRAEKSTPVLVESGE